MSGESLNTSLIEVLKASTVQSNERMDNLTDTMVTLAKTVERSEQRHLSHTEGLERVGAEVKELTKEVKIYNSNNDIRVMDVEKQVLLLDSSKDRTQKRFNKQDKFIFGILSTVVATGSLIYIGFK